MELGFMDVVIIIIGVLSIVLFFKVWIMTINIAKITSQVCESKDYSYYLLKGDKEGLAKALEEDMLIEASRIYSKKGIDADEVNKLDNIRDLISYYDGLSKKYNVEFPDRYKEYTNEDKLSELLSK